MRKLIAAINMTLDGVCDHTAAIADDALHQHYNALMAGAGTLLYGRITYQLMESSWPAVVKNPTGNPSTDAFARWIDRIPKVVFSRTLHTLEWHSASLAKGSIQEVVQELKRQPGKPIFVGSPSLITTLTGLNLLDEYQLCVHPVIAGSGMQLFSHVHDRTVLQLVKTKTLEGGQIVLYYEPTRKEA